MTPLMFRLPRLVALVVLLGVVSACDTAVLYNCKAACERTSNSILLLGRNPDGEPFGPDDQADLCEKPAVLSAVSCSECRQAFEQEYSLRSEEMVCTCPEDGDTIANLQEDCTLDDVEPTFEACSVNQSSEQDELRRRCLVEG